VFFLVLNKQTKSLDPLTKQKLIALYLAANSLQKQFPKEKRKEFLSI
jgi:hypothetical protein